MKGTPLNDELVDYMNDIFPVEDELLRQLRADADAAGIPAIQISPEQGAFLQVLLRAIGARRVLEIGTLAGYSAIIMARALPADGLLISLELDETHASFAREQVVRAGLDDRIDIRVGSALDQLEHSIGAGSGLEGPFDFVFIDADKQNYTRYLRCVIPLMRSGGIIAADNALWHGRVIDSVAEDSSLLGIQEFNRAMAEEPRLQSCIVPIGDGLCIGTVLARKSEV